MQELTPDFLLAYRDNFKLKESVNSVCLKKSDVRDPFFTIIIPTYKRPDLLKEAIDSAIHQMDPGCPYEILVIDNDPSLDCPTNTLILAKYSDCHLLSYYKNEDNLGMFGNWNRGCELSKGEWICMLHDDDLLLKHYLLTLKKTIVSNQDILLLGNVPIILNVNHKPSLSKKLTKPIRGLIKSVIKLVGVGIRGNLIRLKHFDFVTNVPIRPAGFCVKRSVVFENGGFGSSLYLEDHIFFIKIFLNNPGRVYVLNKPLAIYRILVNKSLDRAVRESFSLYNAKLGKYLLHNQKKSVTKAFLSNWLMMNKTKKSHIKFMVYHMVIMLYCPYLLPKSRCLYEN